MSFHFPTMQTFYMQNALEIIVLALENIRNEKRIGTKLSCIAYELYRAAFTPLYVNGFIANPQLSCTKHPVQVPICYV